MKQKLKLDPKNARRHPEKNKALIRQSLEDVGAFRSIGVDGDGIIRAGNGVFEQAQKLGMKVRLIDAKPGELIAVRRPDLKGKKAIRAALYDNRTSETSEWDFDVLGELAEDFNLPEMGFTGKEFADLDLSEEPEIPEPQIDKAAELQKKWGTKRGQIWQIGKHRLACDSCDALPGFIKDKKFALALTDPPYGVGWEYENTEDTEENLKKLVATFLPGVRNASDVTMVTTGNKNQWLYPRPDWTPSWFCAAGIGRGPWGFTCWQPILAYGRDPYLRRGLGSRPDAAEFQGGKTDFAHPCPKPEGVWRWLMDRGSVSTDDCVLDVFSGSGTTMSVAERTGRTCYAMEISPAYVAVSLQRLSDMGLKPKLVKS